MFLCNIWVLASNLRFWFDGFDIKLRPVDPISEAAREFCNFAFSHCFLQSPFVRRGIAAPPAGRPAILLSLWAVNHTCERMSS